MARLDVVREFGQPHGADIHFPCPDFVRGNNFAQHHLHRGGIDFQLRAGDRERLPSATTVIEPEAFKYAHEGRLFRREFAERLGGRKKGRAR